MKWVRRIVRITASLSLLLPFYSGTIASADAPPLIISEVKVRNDTAGFDEFIELYNPGTESISLNDYFIGYINSPAPAETDTFATSVIGEGLLPAESSYVLAKNEADPNLPHAKKSPFSSLADSGGTLRILDSEGVIIDQFSWTATATPTNPAAQVQCTLSNATCNPNRAQSFQRDKDVDGAYIYLDPTWHLLAPTPLSVDLLPLPVPEPEPDPEPQPEPEPTPGGSEQSSPEPEPTPETPPPSTPELLPPQITELLPNPAAPASDSSDEFIELYNPNDQPLDLTGYKLQSGNTFNYSYTFASTTLNAREYKAFMVTETGAILSNTSGQARLLDSGGVVVAQTNAYDTADDGEAWALINGAWQWTTSPTPNAENQLTTPVLKVATAKTAAVKKPAAAKPATAKKAAATPKVAAAKTAKAAAATREVYEDPAETTPAVHPGILAGVGVITLVYAAYEYRYDVVNRIQQLKRYRELRRAARAKP